MEVKFNDFKIDRVSETLNERLLLYAEILILASAIISDSQNS